LSLLSSPLCVATTLVIDTARTVCNGTMSVRLSVCMYTPAIDRCSSVRRVCCRGSGGGGQEISIDCCINVAGAQQQRRRSSTAVSSKGEQCRVYSRRRRLNTDLLVLSRLWFVNSVCDHATRNTMTTSKNGSIPCADCWSDSTYCVDAALSYTCRS